MDGDRNTSSPRHAVTSLLTQQKDSAILSHTGSVRSQESEAKDHGEFPTDRQRKGQPNGSSEERCENCGVGSHNSSGLQSLLQELTEWLSLREEELDQPSPLGGDTSTLHHQRQQHQFFEEELRARGPFVNSVLEAARNFLSQRPPVDTEDTHSLNISDDSCTDRHAVRWVWRETGQAAALWERVLLRCTGRGRQIEGAVGSMDELEKRMQELYEQLQEAQGVLEAWDPLGDLLIDSLQDHIDATRLFQEELHPVEEGLRRVNEIADQLSVNGVGLSEDNTHTLHHLNSHWRLLQGSIEDRLQELQEANRDFGPHSQHFLSGSVQSPWERAISANGVPYYINHSTQTTSWDHPKMAQLYRSMEDLNKVRFSAYRTAMKLRRIQKTLKLESLTLTELQNVVGVMFGSVVVGSAGTIDVLEVIHMLISLYEHLQQEKGMLVNIPLSVDMCLNWLLNVYDSGRAGKVHLLSIMTGLVCLCGAHVKDKCKFLFQQVCGADGGADEAHLSSLLQVLIQIPRQLGEVAAFGGSNVEPSVTSCFRMVPGRLSVEEADFLDWMALEPQAVVWLSVLHRVAQSEPTLHRARCSLCRQSPICGFRYRSLKQFNVDICQTCFLSGRATKGKNLHYPIIEYYTQSTSGEKMRDFAVTLKNKFRSKEYFSRHPQRGYLPVQSALGPETGETPSLSPKLPHADTHTRIERFANRLAEVEDQSCSFFNHSLDEEQYSLCYSSSGVEADPVQCTCLPASTGHETQEELQRTLTILEEQNRILQREYRRLQWQHTEAIAASPHLVQGSPGSPGVTRAQSEAMLAEAKALRQHKSRLEARMEILEEHNTQLESQLCRVRELLLRHRDGSETSLSTGSPASGRSPASKPNWPRTKFSSPHPPEPTVAAMQGEGDGDSADYLQQVIEQLRTVFPSEGGSPTAL